MYPFTLGSIMKTLAEVLSGGLPQSKWQPPPKNIELLKTYMTITTGPKRTIWYKSQIASQSIYCSYPGQFCVRPEFAFLAIEEYKIFHDNFENLQNYLLSILSHKKVGYSKSKVSPRKKILEEPDKFVGRTKT